MQRHDLDPTSLLFGVLFTLVGLAVLTGAELSLDHLRWVLPALAILVGALIALRVVRRLRDRPERGFSADKVE